ncbi:IMP dehydrogenase, partial [Bacillus sp. WP8]|uniref:IMP dehydrogenase n=1 Tax=Bacillus sp. WP8 TaxID=756828 RepID=UPI001642AA9A
EHNKKFLPEGIQAPTPYKPPLLHTLYQLLPPIPSPIPYSPTHHLPTLTQQPHFIRITRAALRQTHPHDLQITKQ